MIIEFHFKYCFEEFFYGKEDESMQVIRKINNNAAVCLDSSNHELVAFGNGIGFPKVPYELVDLSIIKHTYYDVDARYIGLLNELSEDIIEVSSQIVELARSQLTQELNGNVVFTLADHLAFAIERMKQQIDIRNPLAYDLRHLYPKEMEIGRLALQLVENKLGVHLLESEITSVALHLINAENGLGDMNDTVKVTRLVNDITCIIQDYFDLQLDKKGLAFSRFVVHLHYLIIRSQQQQPVETSQASLYAFTKQSYPKTYRCLLMLKRLIEQECSIHLQEDEELYLMIHLNRLIQVNE